MYSCLLFVSSQKALYIKYTAMNLNSVSKVSQMLQIRNWTASAGWSSIYQMNYAKLIFLWRAMVTVLLVPYRIKIMSTFDTPSFTIHIENLKYHHHPDKNFKTEIAFILWSCGLLYHAVWWVVTNISEEHTASVFRLTDYIQHHVIMYKTTIWTFASIKTSNKLLL
jgi:hypothetical protein